jgi:UDP-N-acetylmuramate dehydrogenase
VTGLLRVLRERFGDLVREVMLRDLTTWRIGGPSAMLDLPAVQTACDAVGFLDELGASRFVLGRGSNLLASDAGFDGVLLRLCSELQTVAWKREAGRFEVHAGGGASLPRLSGVACMKGASGLTFAVGIPGTLGGAVCMNAGAYGSCVGNFVSEVEVVAPGGRKEILSSTDCDFGYRRSRFQGSGSVIASAALLLPEGAPAALRRDARDILEKRRKAFPLHRPNAGSVFRRPKDGPAPGFLIEKAGLKGTRVGGAAVSDIHANFIVNCGNATSSDVAGLIRIVKDAVLKEFGISLLEEIVYLGFDGRDQGLNGQANG